MPCYTVQNISVDLHLANEKLILQALEKLGARYVQVSNGVISFYQDGTRYRLANGQLTGNLAADVAQKLKVAYTKEAVSAAARRAGWTVQEKSETKLQVQRRY